MRSAITYLTMTLLVLSLAPPASAAHCRGIQRSVLPPTSIRGRLRMWPLREGSSMPSGSIPAPGPVLIALCTGAASTAERHGSLG